MCLIHVVFTQKQSIDFKKGALKLSIVSLSQTNNPSVGKLARSSVAVVR